MVAVFVGNSLRATMYAARIAAASGDAPQGDGGFDANGRYGPSRTAFTASNIASCAMVVRICVRNAFSGTDAPSAVNRLPQSSSTDGPVKGTAERPGAAFVPWPRSVSTAATTTRITHARIDFRRVISGSFPSCALLSFGKRKSGGGTTIKAS